MRRSGRPTRIGELLDISMPAAAARRRPMTALVRAWPGAVGDVIARCSWPARMSDGVLVVHAESSVWVSELQLLEPLVLDRLRAALAVEAPTAIRFQVGPLPAPVEPPADPARPVSAAQRRRAAQLASAIGDVTLRAHAEAAIAGSLARTESA
jgi:hypothetical protein